MSQMWLVARRELRSYFSHWTGYLIIAAALFISGLLFNAFALGKNPKYSMEVLRDFFYFFSGLTIVTALLLSMRLIAEERQNKTLVLFSTAPISERQLVYGKFLSALIFLGFMFILSLYMPALVARHGFISLGHLGAGYLCMILLGGAVISMTLLASSLASTQIMAAFIGILITVSFLVMWMLADVVETPFRELFTWMALHNKHFNPFAKGIVHLRDVIYYLSVWIFFLECSVRVLESRRWS